MYNWVICTYIKFQTLKSVDFDFESQTSHLKIHSNYAIDVSQFYFTVIVLHYDVYWVHKLSTKGNKTNFEVNASQFDFKVNLYLAIS